MVEADEIKDDLLASNMAPLVCHVSAYGGYTTVLVSGGTDVERTLLTRQLSLLLDTWDDATQESLSEWLRKKGFLVDNVDSNP